MNKTKKLTQGSMLLAIVGALILIDRMSAYWFSEIIALMIPAVIIIYCAMYSLKDGLVLSVGLTIITFLLCNFQFYYLVYVPVGILTGLVYSYGISRNMDRHSLLLLAIISYVIGEVIATFIVGPIFGFKIETMIAEQELVFNGTNNLFGLNFAEILSSLNLDISKLMVVAFVLTVILVGVMEGVLIHLLSIFLLKRFKIKDLGRVNLFELKPNPIIAYLSMIAIIVTIYLSRTGNDTLSYTSLAILMIAALILMYYGYIFILLYGVMVLKRNVGPIFMLLVLFFPPILISLIIIGFLYGSGPLRRYLEAKVTV